MSGTPTKAGVYNFSVTAFDFGCSGDTSAPTPFSITIFSPSENFYVLNADGGALSVIPINGGTGMNCAWANSSQPCWPYINNPVDDFTVDRAGDFIIPVGSWVLQFKPGSASPTVVASAAQLPSDFMGGTFFSVAVDSAGNYIVADNQNHAIWLFPAAGGTADACRHLRGIGSG